ncbi:MAG: virulence RhuM family protein, partial [Bacteroidales bacterium]|nr:virulence RhuM family protein [Bacteroidales bacterium]
METQNIENEIVLYEVKGLEPIEVRVANDTVWLTQAQMAQLFLRDVSVISRHIKNAFNEGELDKKSNLHFLQIANSDKPVTLFSLDVIISVGYRVKSQRGTQFRIWANRVLKEYILRGAAVNQRIDCVENRLLKNEHHLLTVEQKL